MSSLHDRYWTMKFGGFGKEKQMTLRLFRMKHWSQHRGEDGSAWHREKAFYKQQLFMTLQHITRLVFPYFAL